MGIRRVCNATFDSAYGSRGERSDDVSRQNPPGKHINLSTSAEIESARRMKEQLCRVAMNFDEEMTSFDEHQFKDFTLPDGHVIGIGDQLIRTRSCSSIQS